MKSNHKALMLIICLMLLVLTACSDLKCGRVIDKHHYKSETIMTPVFNGKSTIIVPVTNPERFEITITDGDITDCTVISKEKYKEIEIGDFYKVEEKE